MIGLLRKLVAAFRAAILATLLFWCFSTGHATATPAALFAIVGDRTPAPPIGWVQFCQTYQKVCDTAALPPRDVVLDDKAWAVLERVNGRVNRTIKPVTDMDHYGMIQWWRYPDDGSGACHSYALLKRRMLIEAGWPRQALLMTIVHEPDGDGHAVLTVKTDRGEFILDNLTDDIRLWSKTPYRFYKRQSQADPNVWMWIDDTHTAVAGSSGGGQ